MIEDTQAAIWLPPSNDQHRGIRTPPEEYFFVSSRVIRKTPPDGRFASGEPRVPPDEFGGCAARTGASDIYQRIS